ncbi:MAG TPA: M14 metallopeptidase family protein [Pyrinomonadaceae bacterium]|nr:M14 metallopeptidase family protein [Pyrinomonadaceae bacterium]
MRTRTLPVSLIATFFILLLSLAGSEAGAQSSDTTAPRVPEPASVLSFRPGDDRKLASWASVVEYFERLDEASGRVVVEELGKTTMGAPFIMAIISAPENLARLGEFKEIQRQLADPRSLGVNADPKAQRLIARGKTIVLITCGIHSTEVGSYLSSMLIAHRLASSDDAETRSILRDSIILLVPSLNPDGVDIVKNWYDRTLGTPFEGTDPPVLYHKYTGHDNNRDWYAFTQKETRITVDKIHNVWHPQIVHDIHQQGTYGSRLFLPPYMQPVEPNVPKGIVEGYTELGRAMAAELRASGFKGITNDSTYDAWTPARAYSHYHGGVRILSETASAKIATPVNVRFEELRSREGYDPQKESANFGPVWRGGLWRLRDITDYMTTAAFSLLKHAARNRVRWLTRFYQIGKEAVRERRAGELYGFLILPDKDNNHYALSDILRRGGVEIDEADQFIVKGKTYPQGTRAVRLAQPYGGFAKALLEAQHYPDLRDSVGHPIPPYDVTAHTLPLLMGVEVVPVYEPYKKVVFPKNVGEGYGYGVGSGTGTLPPPPRTALYKSHVPSLDEGWTRWVFENRYVRYLSLEDKEVRAGDLRARFDTIIIPDQAARAILEGYKPGSMPEEYTGGLGAAGVSSLREFVEGGGTLICLNRASRFAIEQFHLPLRDVTENLKRTEFYVPGSILRIELDASHPLAVGMPKESIAWAEDSPVFEIKSDTLAQARVQVVARYPQTANPLLSGWLLGGERIKGKAALVEVRWGRGRIYLFGFRPQYRAQSLATYGLLFNAIGQADGK